MDASQWTVAAIDVVQLAHIPIEWAHLEHKSHSPIRVRRNSDILLRLILCNLRINAISRLRSTILEFPRLS